MAAASVIFLCTHTAGMLQLDTIKSSMRDLRSVASDSVDRAIGQEVMAG